MVLLSIWSIYEIYDSQFWDEQRVEKAVKANVVKGDSPQTVLRTIKSCGMNFKIYTAAQKNLNYQLKNAPTQLNASQVDTLIWANAKEGAIPTDNFSISIYFYFDKHDRLIKYDFYKVWNGL